MPVKEPWSFEKSITAPILYLSQFIEPGDSVIDIGCGTGGCMRFLKEHIPDIKITGLTNSKATLETCQSQGAGRIVLGDFNEMPVNSLGHYDVAYLMESFFYFGKSYDDKVLTLKRIKNVASRLVARILTFPDGHPQPEGFWGRSGLALTLTELNQAILEAGWMDPKYHVTPHLNDKRFAGAYFEIFQHLAKKYNEVPPRDMCYYNSPLKAYSKGDVNLDVLATHVVAKAN
jgi:cyclopropane fatty-acyl-phospholipid synthase-like methyltransferase